MSQKISFFAQFQVFFKNKIKSITCLTHYVALHHWSKLQTNLITIQWVTSKKPPRSSLKLYLLLLWKHLKFQNSRTTNQTWMKLGPYMYQLNTFNIPKMRVSIMGEWDGGVQPKTTRKCHEIKRNLTTYFSAYYIISMISFFCKILRHPQINPASVPVICHFILKMQFMAENNWKSAFQKKWKTYKEYFHGKYKYFKNI